MPTCDETLGSNAVGAGVEEKKVVREEDREGVTGVSLLSSAFRFVSITSRALPAMLYALCNHHSKSNRTHARTYACTHMCAYDVT